MLPSHSAKAVHSKSCRTWLCKADVQIVLRGEKGNVVIVDVCIREGGSCGTLCGSSECCSVSTTDAWGGGCSAWSGCAQGSTTMNGTIHLGPVLPIPSVQVQISEVSVSSWYCFTMGGFLVIGE